MYSSEELSSELASLAAALRSANSGVEPEFEQVGSDLQSIFASCGELEDQTAAAAKMMGRDSDDSILTLIDMFSTQSIDVLHSTQERISRSLECIERISTDMNLLRSENHRLDRTGKKLRVVGVNIRVESVRRDESHAMFASFVEEMDRLVEKVLEVSGAISSGARNAEAEQTQASKDISAGACRLTELTRDGEVAVIDAAERMEHAMDASTRALEVTGTHSQEIKKHTGEIVMALQVRDITRQQAEHVGEALTDLQQSLQGQAAGWGEDSVSPEVAGRVWTVLQVQTAQMAKIIESLESAYRTLMDAFGLIGDEVTGMTGATEDIRIGCDSTSEGEDGINLLQSSMSYLGTLISQGQNLNGQTSDTAAKASRVTELLSRHMDEVGEISVDMNLQALNAIIKSVRLGDSGKTLQVLSHEVTVLSEQSSRFVQEVLQVLERIEKSAQELNDASSTDSPRGERESGAEETSNGDQLEFSDLCAKMGSTSEDAVAKAESLVNAIGQTHGRLEFLTELIGQLSSVREKMSALQSSIGSEADVVSTADQSAMEQIVNRYTMASEREIHEQIVNPFEAEGETAEQELVLAGGSADMGESDDLDDNVELF